MAKEPKKKTTKKATPSAEKKAPAKAKKPFNLLTDGDAVVGSFQETLTTINARAKNRKVNMTSMGSFDQPKLPIPHMLLEYLFGSRWIRSQTIIELIGSPGMGKTTLSMIFMGYWMQASDVLSVYIETENKPLTNDRIKRALSTDKKLASRCLELLRFSQAFSHLSLFKQLDTFMRAIRGKEKNGNKVLIPTDIPVVGLVDTVSKVASNEEAVGVDEGMVELMNDKLVRLKKDIGNSNPMSHGKAWAQWAVQAAPKMRYNNITFFFISHQNDHIDMSSNKATVNKEWAEMRNKTRRGARALNQSAAYQIIGIKSKEIVNKSTKETIGHLVRMRMDKNTYGPENRQIRIILKSDNAEKNDTASTYDSPFMFDEGFCDMLEERGILGVKLDDKNNFLYSSKSLGLTMVPASEIYNAIISDASMRANVGAALRIEGYQAGQEPSEDDVVPAAPTAEDFARASEDRVQKAGALDVALSEAAAETGDTQEDPEYDEDDDLGVEALEGEDE